MKHAKPLANLAFNFNLRRYVVDRLVEVLTTRIWKPNNYFYYGYIVGEFAPDVCPRYLEQKNFAVMKQRVDRVKAGCFELNPIKINCNPCESARLQHLKL
jgi:hypothetical protein